MTIEEKFATKLGIKPAEFFPPEIPKTAKEIKADFDAARMFIKEDKLNKI